MLSPLGLEPRSRGLESHPPDEQLDVAQFGSAHALGAWGRGFKSHRPDVMKDKVKVFDKVILQYVSVGENGDLTPAFIAVQEHEEHCCSCEPDLCDCYEEYKENISE